MSGKYVLAFIILIALVPAAGAQSVPVTKTNPTKVYMHYMPWFDGPDNPVAGQTYGWGWHWTMNNKNPNIIDSNGKRQIASHYYPLIGPYASKDPHVVEYHLLLMKLSGVDGLLIDWYGTQGTNGDVNSLLTNSNAIINKTEGAGLDFALVLEDRFWSSLSAARTNLTYAKNFYFNKSNYIRHGAGDDPLVSVFGPITHQTPAAWTDILSYAGEDVEFLTLWYEKNDAGVNADGEYAWIYSDYLTGLNNFYNNRAPGLGTAMGIAYPGFKDFYAQGGAGSSYFNIPENNGQTLDETLAAFESHSASLDFLQLATFNDFGEGTIFEPTMENGFKYLARIQEFTGVSYTEDDLKKVHRLFTLRKKYFGKADKQSKLDNAFDYFIALELDNAVAVMDTVAGVFGPVQLPGLMEAERFVEMSGIETENTNDTGGGLSITSIDADDFLDYEIEVFTSMEFDVTFRVASASAGGNLQLKLGSEVLVDIQIPQTGGDQVWTTVSSKVTLEEGSHSVRLLATSGGFSLNWVKFSEPVVMGVAEQESGVDVFPTRVQRTLNIHSDGLFSSVLVMDITGKAVYKKDNVFGEREMVLDLDSLSPGLHLIRLNGEFKNVVLRILKE